MSTAPTTPPPRSSPFPFDVDVQIAVLMAAEPVTDPASPWHGELVVPAHVGDGRHVGPFGGMVDLSEALAIVTREDVQHHWDPDTGALVSTADAIDGFRWTFPTITQSGQ